MCQADKLKRIFLITLILGAVGISRCWAQHADPSTLGFQKKFILEIENRSTLPLENYPVIIDVDMIREAYPDFNSSNYALFEEIGREYLYVVSQADDLDKDKYHDEIVFVRTLLPSSTIQLTCYYSPRGTFQLMATLPKASTRLAWDEAKEAAGWESDRGAFKFVSGRIGLFGKFAPSLILKMLRPEPIRRPEWGMDILDIGETSGLGGLSIWEGKTRLPLMNAEGEEAIAMEKTVIASGPIRALIKIDFTGVRSEKGDYDITLLLSAFADNGFSRQDVSIKPPSGDSIVFSPGIAKLAEERWTLKENNGYAFTWGQGVRGAGEIGLATLFDPTEFIGMEEENLERFIQLRASPDKPATYWILGAWEKGFDAPLVPATRNFEIKVSGLSRKLLAPVAIRIQGVGPR